MDESRDVGGDINSHFVFPEGMDAELANFFESDMLRLDEDLGLGFDVQGNGQSEIFGFFDAFSYPDAIE